SSLLWDESRGTASQKTPVVNNRLIADLNKAYANRLKTDPNLGRFVDSTAVAKKNMKDTRVSLNEVVRKKEMEEAQKQAADVKLNTKIVRKEGEVSSDLRDLS